jgi:formamidopyrimidine-DNA glycosylase
MPELPEVETIRRGILPHIIQQQVQQIVIRQSKLRWRIPDDLPQGFIAQTIKSVTRRGKYLLLTTQNGTAIIHLGMSGRLRILPAVTAPEKHDHFDILFGNQKCLRFTDPRRFGALLWTKENPKHHVLLKNLGPEPLLTKFNGDYLFMRSRNKTTTVKQFIMDAEVVVGVGNIYANEALFAAKIHPLTKAGKISRKKYEALSTCIKKILTIAIKQGGTTLRDFYNSDNKPGYFSQKLKVYSREGSPCITCKTILKLIRINQRATVYCSQCQKQPKEN